MWCSMCICAYCGVGVGMFRRAVKGTAFRSVIYDKRRFAGT